MYRPVLETFNIRQLQVYAAVCLRDFCRHKGIRHQLINELIHHLVSLMTAKNLPDWERRGTLIAIVGRGDPLPEDVAEIVETGGLKEFSALIEFCIEVGIVDMYGAHSNKPFEFTEKCIDILIKNNIKLSPTDMLRKYGRGTCMWGDPISDSELSEIFDAYGLQILGHNTE